MAANDLKVVLESILADIHKNSATWRRLVSDKKVHFFSMEVNDVKLQVKKQLVFHLGKQMNPNSLPREYLDIIEREVPKFVKAVYDELVDEVEGYNRKNKAGSAAKATTASIGEGSTSTNFTATFAANRNVGVTNVFNAVKKLKQRHQKTLVGALNKLLLQQGKNEFKGGRGGSSFLDVGHLDDSSVVGQRALAADAALVAFSQTSSGNKILQKEIANLQLQFSPFIQRFSKRMQVKGSTETITVGIESAYWNRNTKSKEELFDINKEIKKIVSKIDAQDFAELQGSDSYAGRVNKNFRKLFYAGLSATPNVKIKKESTQVSKSAKGKVYGAKIRTKSEKGRTEQPVSNLQRSRGVPLKGAAGAPLMLLAMINQRLPETVRKNMVAPALVNRTGTFANSVHLTDVSQTPQGFPSFGYSYQKNPYEVFEMGLGDPRWSTPERDPKTIINKSIREVAAEFAIGRFYTRRQ